MNKAIFPGSFDPITNGHINILERALERFDEIIVLVAINKDKKPNFTLEKRVEMINNSISDPRIKVDSYEGLTMDYAKKCGIRFIIRGYRNKEDLLYEKELENEYKKTNPDMEMVLFEADANLADLSSSQIMENYHNNIDVSNSIPKGVALELYK